MYSSFSSVVILSLYQINEYWLIDWLTTDWLTDCLIDWLIDCLIDWLIDRSIDRLIELHMRFNHPRCYCPPHIEKPFIISTLAWLTHTSTRIKHIHAYKLKCKHANRHTYTHIMHTCRHTYCTHTPAIRKNGMEGLVFLVLGGVVQLVIIYWRLNNAHHLRLAHR